MAIKVGIVSDTHGLLRPEVVGTLKNCDYILHAGDFAEEHILDKLRLMRGKLYAVRGNNDFYWAQNLRQRLRFRIGELEFLLVHDRYDAGRMAAEADVIVHGHTHRYSEEVVDGRLWLNPGSCGRPRFGGEVSFAVMEIDGRNYKITKIPL
ncbi:MAG: metallophosphatase family protein [Clostridiales bacterium]|nr:metallophosphatase family protein [Clostridiales bacterium]